MVTSTSMKLLVIAVSNSLPYEQALFLSEVFSEPVEANNVFRQAFEPTMPQHTRGLFRQLCELFALPFREGQFVNLYRKVNTLLQRYEQVPDNQKAGLKRATLPPIFTVFIHKFITHCDWAKLGLEGFIQSLDHYIALGSPNQPRLYAASLCSKRAFWQQLRAQRYARGMYNRLLPHVREDASVAAAMVAEYPTSLDVIESEKLRKNPLVVASLPVRPPAKGNGAQPPLAE